MKDFYSNKKESAKQFTDKVNSIPSKPSAAFKARVANLKYEYDHQLSDEVKAKITAATVRKLNDAAKYIDNALMNKVALSQKKINAKNELQNTYRLQNYRTAQQPSVRDILQKAFTAIEGARTAAAVNRALSTAKSSLSKIKTSAQIAQSVANVTPNYRTVNTATIAAIVARAGGNPQEVKTVTLGRGVAKLAPSSLAKFKGVTTLVVTSTKLAKKKAVKNSLKGSNVSTVKVKLAGSKKAKKKALKKFKKAFSKKNCGKKVRVVLG